MPAAEVLVVDAGPTGLALALQAHDHGARVRIVERRPEMFRPSRALILHPRTLEVLRPLAVTESLLARADVAPEVPLHLGSRMVPVGVAELELSDTAFPHLSLVRQMDVETVLSQALADRGVYVERGVELIEVREGVTCARATLRSRAGIEQRDYDFVLASYDLELRPAARRVLAMTHVAFWAEASAGPLPSLLRGVMAPLGAPVVPVLIGRRRLVAEAVRWISHLRVAHPDSLISV